ncbi:hypothetical protein ACTJJ0_21655 [Chitinophaga sp. 22321]|uniref:Uncharacterized protein n=1 Tax=Chitinophaga hostae TaxID=2831022 RepID=A0ABS5J4E2_9BACT|nr:hypothetical protein [Chitinophaga hostae]MBS0030094.1 hypothetical protein [Chitinophaga hostae]
MKLIPLLLVLATIANAQKNIANFSVWKPKDGQAANFEAGYKQHLRWHLINNDTWNWYGWYFIAGPRDGQFLDATFGHSWDEFDHRANPTGDAVDNALHTEPFANFLAGYKAVRLALSAPEDSVVLGSRLMRMLTIQITNTEAAIKFVGTLKQKVRKFLAYQVVDGGNLNQLIVFIGSDSFEEYGKSAGLIDKLEPQNGIGSIMSETLVLRRDMSINLY